MITCIIGTRAQLIKMAPVIKELEFHHLNFQILLTGQHKETMDALLNNFDISKVPIQLESQKEVSSVFKMMFWFPRTLIKMFLRRKKLFKCDANTQSWILVHGDTLSTLLGALVGKFTPCKVAHIESGLRSNSYLSPFPEELTRVMTFRLSDVGFCPGQWAVDNLTKYKLKAVNTVTNTIVDAVKVAIASSEVNVDIPVKKYAVVSIHRFENIYKKTRFRQILDVIKEISNEYLILFVLHPSTKKRLVKYGWMDELNSSANIQLKPRMGYIPFVKLLNKSSFVVTDGGSNQEELAFLNIPTLVMRDATERPEGLGKTAVLNGFKTPVAREFLSRIIERHEPCDVSVERSPSRLIVEYLINN